MPGFVLMVTGMVGLAVWLVVQEMKYHSKTGDNNGFRLTVIVAIATLLLLMLLGLPSGTHRDSDYNDNDGDPQWGR